MRKSQSLRQRLYLTALCLIGLGAVAACQIPPPPSQPARIVSADMAALTDALETIVGRSNISIVPEDLIGAESLSVPPPPLGQYETRSPVLPRQFDVVLFGRACFLRDKQSEVSYPATGLRCEPMGPS